MATSRIGRYEIRAELGRGGMATVYRGYDPTFEREVAIKVLPQAFTHDPQFRTRFEREAKMIALLEHPAIVPVYDFGEQDGQPYIVMRYMAGGSLADRLEQGAISLSETAQIISRLAPALDAAHARNIVHRDLKPGNVLFDQYGNAFLSDFGIARAAEYGGQTLTGSAILGTPAYMSPEQVQGEKQLDGRSDIYALGVLVYQMLTGDVPYQSETPAKVMMMHVLAPVPNIREARPDLPESVHHLITKAMAKNPSDRFATASELAAILEGISRGESFEQATSEAEVVVSVGKVKTPAPAAPSAAEPTRLARAAPTRPAMHQEAAMPLPQEAPRRTPSLLWPIVAVLAIVVVAALALGGLGVQGRGPLAAFLAPPPTATQLPATLTPTQAIAPPTATVPAGAPPPETEAPSATPTEALPTPTEAPTLTPTPAAPIIGGADKIAWLMANDIYVANLDGTELVRLTEDGTTKTNLEWTPDGQAINFISGKCVYTVRLSDTKVDIIVCFNFVDYLKSFRISPDGKQVAISLDNQLYIVPYEIEKLNAVKTRGGLTEMAECKDFGPYTRNFVKMARWSSDGQYLAMVIFGVAADIGSADIIQIIDITKCTASPRIIDNFPPPRFRMPAYERAPSILNFGWDGLYLFVFNTLIRNNGYGDLYIYNMDLHKARMEVNPINNSCCYRDAQWSPDGTHLLFAYQDYSKGAAGVVQFYLIPYGTIGTGATYTPLPLPEITDINESPQPTLRPAK